MDAKEIPNGTDVLIRLTKTGDCGISYFSARKGMDSYSIPNDAIECIAPPKPEPIKVGDVVQWTTPNGLHEIRYKVLGVMDRFLWVIRGDPGPKYFEPETFDVKFFKKVND